jgi:hypothetical protein
MTNVDKQFDDLRDLVRKLDPTGPDGFEGLMAAMLTDNIRTSPVLLASFGSILPARLISPQGLLSSTSGGCGSFWPK